MKKLILICLSVISLFDLNGQDLQMSNIATLKDTFLPKSKISEYDLSTTCTITNLSNIPISQLYYNSIFLSKDQTLDSTDFEIIYYEGSFFSANSSNSIIFGNNQGYIFSKEIPYNYLGNYYLLFVADSHNNIVETNENNNIQSKLINIISCGDLSIKFLSYPDTIDIGKSLVSNPVTIEIKNNGPNDVNNITFYTTFNNSKNELFELKTNESKTLLIEQHNLKFVNTTLNPNANTKFIANVRSNCLESNYSDNSDTTGSISLKLNKSIKITNIVGPSIVTPGNTYQYTFTIKNNGEPELIDSMYFYQLVSASSMKCCGSSNLYPITNSFQKDLGILQTGESKTITTNVTFKSDFFIGNRFELYQNNIQYTELMYLGTSNAKLPTYTLADTIPINYTKFDLKPKYNTSDISVKIKTPNIYFDDSGEFTAIIEIENKGIENARFVKINYGISGSASFFDAYKPKYIQSSKGKVLVNTYNGAFDTYLLLDSLDVNEKVTINIRYKIGNGTPQYPFHFMMDFWAGSTGYYIDSNTTNNGGSLQFLRLVPDLELSNLVLKKYNYVNGDSISFSVDIKNIGLGDYFNYNNLFEANLHNITTNVNYILLNPLPDLRSILISKPIIGKIFSAKLPNNLPLGTYRLNCKIDAYDNIHELNENNNSQISKNILTLSLPNPQKQTPKGKTQGLKGNSPIYSYTIKANTIKALIYPNPTKDILNIDLKDWDNQAIELKIYNTLGVLTKQVILDENHDNIQQLDIATLQNGNYYMFIESGEERSDALKFVKAE
jgi:Secretion system C-terminal sorting domain/CARDB